ncbi:thioesterase II family protein [Nonomuraea muscovyensis]|uniref:thioesterase II family protein n=1 Tax=Nonomuraea muscovyensis TaxID=1124761 RepID=UPI00341093CA|nr:thioesterase [Nonomuraea muscovyensis]
MTVIADTTTWLRRLRPVSAPWVRLLCFPHAGGNAYFYNAWRAELPPDVELYAVQYPGRLDRLGDPFMEDMERMADAVAQAAYLLTGVPVALFGHSLGAAVAYETARRMRRPPAHLFVSGQPAPDRHRGGTKHLAGDEVLWQELSRLGGASPEVIGNAELREEFLPVMRSDYRLAETYRARPGPPLDCPVTAVIGDRDSEVDEDEARSWERYTSASFALRVFPGGHFYLNPPGPRLIDAIVTRLAEGAPPRRMGWAGP